MYTPIERNLYWGVEFPKTPRFKKTIAQATLTQSEASHDILILIFKGVFDKNRDAIIQKGDPVKFTWGTGAHREVFVGFIELIEKNSTIDRNSIKVVCINNSSVLRVPSKKVYKNVTADRVARICAYETGLAASVEPHPFIHGNLSQSGQTHWQLLGHLAKKTGYALRVENKTLIFKPRHKIIKDKLENAPVFYRFYTFPSGAKGMQTILSFTALDSIESPALNHGDVGLELHNRQGNRYGFNSGTGVHKDYTFGGAVNTTEDWGKVHGSR